MVAQKHDNFKIIWVTDFYDKPLAGLCRVNGELRRFSAEYEEQGYNLLNDILSQYKLILQ